MRKTVSVESVRETANNMFRTGVGSSELRLGVIVLLEEILHQTGNYNGFRYLFEDEVPEHCLPGINSGDGKSAEEKFANTDGTRRFYF